MKSLRKIAGLAAWGVVAGMVGFAPVGMAQQSGNNNPPTGQQTPAQEPKKEQGTTIKVVVPSVELSVTVKDGSGQLVPDLHKDEFRIFEDDVEQTVDRFTSEAVPLSLVILIDNDLKAKDAEQVKNSIKAVIAGLSVNDEAFICRFDQFFHPGKGWTSDQDKLLTELKRTERDITEEQNAAPPSAAINNGPTINGHSAIGDAPSIAAATMQLKGQPTKALDDAVFAAADLLADRAKGRRRLILLVSDGVNGAKFNKNNFTVTAKELVRNEAAVYSIAVTSAFLERKFSRLVDYSKHSGGDVFFAAKQSSLEQLYARITEEARHQYVLTYTPRGTDRNAEYHTIEVRVKREGLKILTREGYFTGTGAGPR
jgi:VWFA-related protein